MWGDQVFFETVSDSRTERRYQELSWKVSNPLRWV
jgi:hypothetical protein